jgi:hypothetical protein
MEKSTSIPTSLISCDVCLKEIPRSAAMTVEGADYVGEYCGLECYQKFLHEPHATATRESVGDRSEDAPLA